LISIEIPRHGRREFLLSILLVRQRMMRFARFAIIEAEWRQSLYRMANDDANCGVLSALWN
jgi:hypothetical protein